MTTEVIYRVQDAEGRGPWKPGFSENWVEDRDDYDAFPPWFVELGPVHLKAITGMNFGCGCRSLDMLRQWIRKSEYEKLKTFGYEAVEMEVGRILGESKIQLVFERIKPLSEDIKIVELY